MRPDWLKSLSPELPVLISGPTASGKSAFALEIAADQGGVIVNADALQVFSNWRILTSRPSRGEEAIAPHRLYGHIAGHADYSVGQWLRELKREMGDGARLIIVGGTGLYFAALTEGLADIPPTPDKIRAEADDRLQTDGVDALLADLDPDTTMRIDQQNPMRVQRAWEVWRTTGRSLASWQDTTPAPLMPLRAAQTLLIDADRDWLTARIDRRFDAMIANGALEEARANMTDWNATRPSSKAIGAPELVAYIRGKRDLKDAVAAGKTATRQYAKRQRTWFRSKMRAWRSILLP